MNSGNIGVSMPTAGTIQNANVYEHPAENWVQLMLLL